jgi:hypothetical protein
MKPVRKLPPVGIFVLDETQDITPTYFQFVRKFMDDLAQKGAKPRMVVVGDRYQGIYGFKGADTRFLTLAPDVWNWSEFCPLTLSTSYRITRQIAAFVNHCMLGYERLSATKDGPAVDYVICNPFGVHRWLARKLCDMIMQGQCCPEDIFILANTIKNPRAPVRQLENCLVESGIPCYFPTSDDRIADDDVLDGKVVFSTFHQAKGRERKVVVLYGFDATYEKFLQTSKGGCPETLYVAATRAKEHLILLQGASVGPLSFLQNLHASPSLRIISLEKEGKEKTVQGDIRTFFAPTCSELHVDTVTNLTRFLGESALYSLNAIVDEVFVEECGEKYTVAIPGKVASGVGWEDVSDINGIVIPAIYEARHCSPEWHTSTIEVDVRRRYDTFVANNTHGFLRRACEQLPDPVRTLEEFLRMGVLYTSVVEQIFNRVQQITRYDWLEEKAVESCFQALRPHLNSETIFEQEVEIQHAGEFGKVHLLGRLDAVNNDCIWEIKCVDTLAVEHFVQVLLYAWIWRNYVEEFGSRVFRIVNIRTGQIFRLRESHLIDEAVQIVFANKWAKKPTLSDSEFLTQCQSTPSVTRDTGTSVCCIED